jgi:hypothetical protein
MLHPVVLAAIFLLVVNDHALKVVAPGFVTGKLSDVAGLVFFPLLLVGMTELVLSRRRVWRGPSTAAVAAAVLATGFAFAAIKLSPIGERIYEVVLGAAQWPIQALINLEAGHSLHGPRDVALARDPSDLLAIIALWLPYQVGTQRARLNRPPPGHGRVLRAGQLPVRGLAGGRISPAGLAVIVAAALASLATSPAPAEASKDYRETITLTADLPVAGRHLSFDLVGNDPAVSSVHLVVSAWVKEMQEGMEVLVPTPNVQVSVIPDDPADGISAADDQFEAPALDLTRLCSAGCHHGANVVLRLIGEQVPQTLEVQLEVGFVALSEVYDRRSLAVDLGLREDPDRRFAGRPQTLVSRIERSIRVSNAAPRADDEVRLAISPDVLTDPLAYPLVGRVRIELETTRASGHPNAHNTSIAIGGDTRFAVSEDPIEADWLANCKPSTRCEIPISIQSEYDPSLNSVDFGPNDSATGFVEMRWVVEARMEAFDGRPLREGALMLTGE